MYPRLIPTLIPVLLACCGVFVRALPAATQSDQGETLVGPDSHEIGQGPHGHLLRTGVAGDTSTSAV